MEAGKIRNGFFLFLTSVIWGVAFVAQTVGMDYVGPYTFTGIRCLLGGIVLLPFIAVTGRKENKSKENGKNELLLGGVVCGVFLFLGTILQQFGLLTTSAGKSGFLTALYIVVVPLLGLFVHKKAGAKLWISVGLALAGLYMLCVHGSFSINKGDTFTICGAVAFSGHILVVDHFTNRVDGVKMSCIQFFVCGVLGILGMFLFETPDVADIVAAAKPIAYAGILSCGVGYTLQIVGQKGMNPTVASLIMSLESVVSALAGWALLSQQLSKQEIAGCVLVFGAILLAQLPDRKLK